MTSDNFCGKIKSYLSTQPPKKGCCRKTEKNLNEALESFPDYELARTAGERVLCNECVGTFLKNLFIKFGTVTDPQKSYHLEMSFSDEAFRDFVLDMMKQQGLNVKSGKRRNKFTVYIKNSGSIEDFFAMTGASAAAFDIMNLKLVKDVRSSINRQNNFETANMQKTANAVIYEVNAVNFLNEHGYIGSLSKELRETARLRVENDTASMSSLASLHTPPISKSGVKHRLDKITEFYESIKNSTEGK